MEDGHAWTIFQAQSDSPRLNKQMIEKVPYSSPHHTLYLMCWYIFIVIWENKYIIDPRPLQPPNMVHPSLQSLFTDLTQMNFYAAQFWKLMEDGHAQTISQTQSNELYFPQKRIFLPPSLRYFSVLHSGLRIGIKRTSTSGLLNLVKILSGSISPCQSHLKHIKWQKY